MIKQRIGNALGILHGFENGAACLVLVVMALLPSAEVVARLFKTGILANTEYLRHLVLWITFLGALITSRQKNHLSLSVGLELLPPHIKRWVVTATATIAAAVCASLTRCAWELYLVAFEPDMTVGLLPGRIVTVILPAGFFLLTVRFISSADSWVHALVRSGGVGIAALIGYTAGPFMPVLVWPLGILLTVSAVAGTPIFVVLGGMALLLFFTAGGSTAVIANEAYTMLTGPIIPTIPLFTLTGFILSESRAGHRLVEFFQAWFGWLPGGLAIMATLVCAFFTTFTGASGVTILALGGLLSVVLLKGNYSKLFTTGLLTATGSIGLLFPPSLPIILYGVVAQLDIKHLFIGGMVPGALMAGMVAALGIRHDLKSKTARRPFHLGTAVSALKAAAWEISMPAAVLLFFFCGLTTLVESAAMAVIYVLIVEVAIHRDIAPRDLGKVMLKAVPLTGGVLIILAVANGLSYYIIDAQIPVQFAAWCAAHITSKYVFLLLLNIALLITGCFMDIFSATLVVVPLIIPLGAAFGIDPIHLGIIFIANLELGYLTPPVGLNLFMSSYRFNEPVVRVYRAVLPFLATLVVTVLLITYIPWLTTGLLGIFGMR